jgi:hypothetical protein
MSSFIATTHDNPMACSFSDTRPVPVKPLLDLDFGKSLNLRWILDTKNDTEIMSAEVAFPFSARYLPGIMKLR